MPLAVSTKKELQKLNSSHKTKPTGKDSIFSPSFLSTQLLQTKFFNTQSRRKLIDLEYVGADGSGDALGSRDILAGNDGQVSDDRLGIERQLRQRRSVLRNDLLLLLVKPNRA